MSIQLNGHVTYPYRAAGHDNDESDDLDLAGADPEDSSPSITWNGWWHYSQKQPRRGTASSSFSYSFVGPEIAEDQEKRSSAPDQSNDVPTSTSTEMERSHVGCREGENMPGGKDTVKCTRDGQRGDNQGVASEQQQSPGQAPLTIDVSLAEKGSQSKKETVSEVHVGKENNSVHKTIGPAQSLQAEQLLLYGPAGDGRLPSGIWRGHFMVKARATEFAVQETFVLEFGSGKSPRTSASAPTAGNAAAPATTSTAASGLVSSASTHSSSTPSQHLPTSSDAAKAAGGAAAAPEEPGDGVRNGAHQSKPPVVHETNTMSTAMSNTSAPSPDTSQQTSTAMLPPPPMPPVVRVSGRGQNRYGEFTLTGGHERATGLLDLTRFYYEQAKSSAGSGPTRGEGRVGRGGSHQKKKRPLAPGALPPQPAGPSLAERRTKRTRCPNQRLMDEEPAAVPAESLPSASVARKKNTGEATTGPSSENAANTAEKSAVIPEQASNEATAASEPKKVLGTKGSRKIRDREHDAAVDQSKRARKKSHQREKGQHSGGELVGARGGTGGAKNSTQAGSTDTSTSKFAAGAQASVEALAGTDLSMLIGTDTEEDQVVKEALVNMEREQADLEAEAAKAAAVEVATEDRGASRTTDASRGDASSAGGSSTCGSVRGRGSSRSARSKTTPHERWRALHFDEENGEYYEGGYHRGKRHGKGFCVYANLNIYEGDWKAGREHGVGKIMDPNRVVMYEGEFVDGKFCGRGRYVHESGETYDGEWKDNARHGRGVYTFVLDDYEAVDAAAVGSGDGGSADSLKSVTIYNGEFRDNVRCGRGLQTWPSGSYDGEWYADAKHGRGVLRTADGFVYDGQWADDLAEGRGICVHPDGQRYEGVFRGGRKEGRGTLAFANGASYEGRFRDDAIDGQGMLQIPGPTEDAMGGWMIPIQFQSDIERIHVKAGFDKGGL